MKNVKYRIDQDKVVIRLKDQLCETSAELLGSKLFLQVLTRAVNSLTQKELAPVGHLRSP